MREELNIFVVPNTKEPLRLKIRQKKGDHIITGSLFTKNLEYPIRGGIPRFIEKSHYGFTSSKSKEKLTSASFGNKWTEGRNKKLGFLGSDTKLLTEQFLASLGCESITELKTLFKKANKTLNAGCGVAWSEYLFNYNPDLQRHCVDISISVETAYINTRHLDNILVSQASIFELPYKDEVFDIIYSLGVIHHTNNPKQAIAILSKKLKPGGLLGLYIYNMKPFLREMSDEKIRTITTKMSYQECLRFSEKMTQLGKALNMIKQPLVVKNDIDILGIKKGSYRIHKFIYDYFLKCWYNPSWDSKYADLVNQDWYHPYYASHHTKEEITDWLKIAGIKNLKFIQPKGWEHSGYFVSGKKK